MTEPLSGNPSDIQRHIHDAERAIRARQGWNTCEHCGAEMNPVEVMLGPATTCGACVRQFHRQATGH